MNKLFLRLKSWFQPQPKSKPAKPSYQPINHKHYRKLIGKLAKQAIAVQRKRNQRRTLC